MKLPSYIFRPLVLYFLIISMLIRLANLKFNGLLPAAIGADLSLIAYKRTLSQPYSVLIEEYK